MEWYYPVLGGALRGAAARSRIDERWDDFVVPGLGIRCVDDRPWVTGAETCELVMALDAIGQTGARPRAVRGHAPPPRGGRLLLDRAGFRRRQALARGAHHMDGRCDDPGRRRAVATTPANGIFRGLDLPRGLEGEFDCECATTRSLTRA